MSDDEDDDGDLLTGLVRPQFNLAGPAGGADDDDDDDDDEEVGQAAPAATGGASGSGGAGDGEEEEEDDDDDDDDDDDAPGGGLVGASAAFELATAPDALELDPFRVAQGRDVPVEANDPAKKGKKGGGGERISRKLFVGGLSAGTTDEALLRFFARYGKVAEAVAVQGNHGGCKGFGFVTFVSDKGARWCCSQAGDPPTLEIEGRQCTVRYAETKDDHGARRHKMPARGNVDYLGVGKRSGGGGGGGSGGGAGASSVNELSYSEMAAPGISTIAQAQRRSQATAETRALPERSDGPWQAPSSAVSEDSIGGAEGGKRKRKNEIVTVTRRQDAEPLNKRPITMKEIFPKEFWRI